VFFEVKNDTCSVIVELGGNNVMGWVWGCEGLLLNDERFILFQIYPPFGHGDPLVLDQRTHGASKPLPIDQ